MSDHVLFLILLAACCCGVVIALGVVYTPTFARLNQRA